MTDRISLDALLNGPDAHNNLQSICQRISAGEVFIYPTETIYGIGGRADFDDVRQKILTAKKRKLDNPMILLAGAKEMFAQCKVEFPPVALALSRRFWPGFLTLVLPVEDSGDTLGVRVSGYPFIKTLFTMSNVPIFSTSANISGSEYENDPDEIYSVFSGVVDFMIDAGKLPMSKPSTVVRVSRDGSVTIMREGAISREKIERVFKS